MSVALWLRDAEVPVPGRRQYPGGLDRQGWTTSSALWQFESSSR